MVNLYSMSIPSISSRLPFLAQLAEENEVNEANMSPKEGVDLDRRELSIHKGRDAELDRLHEDEFKLTRRFESAGHAKDANNENNVKNIQKSSLDSKMAKIDAHSGSAESTLQRHRQQNRGEKPTTNINNSSKSSNPDSKNNNDNTITSGDPKLDALRQVNRDKHKSGHGKAPIHMAALEGRNEVIKMLVKGGADVHCKSHSDGYTAIHYAAENGHVAAVSTLLDLGADPHTIKNKYNWSAFHLAQHNGHRDVVRTILEQTEKHRLSEQKKLEKKLARAENILKGLPALASENLFLCSNIDCDKEAQFACSVCWKVVYCSQECQSLKWSEHKEDCKRTRCKHAKKMTREVDVALANKKKLRISQEIKEGKRDANGKLTVKEKEIRRKEKEAKKEKKLSKEEEMERVAKEIKERMANPKRPGLLPSKVPIQDLGREMVERMWAREDQEREQLARAAGMKIIDMDVLMKALPAAK